MTYALKAKKAQGGVPWVLVTFLLAIVTAAIVGYIMWTSYFQEGGQTIGTLIKTPADLDGDGVPNTRDMCVPAACAPAPGETIIDDPSHARYGCTQGQGVTLEPYARQCNPFVEDNQEASAS